MQYDDQGLAYDSNLEESVLGIILMFPDTITKVLSECKLKSKSFYITKNQKVFETILKLFDENIPPSEKLVSSHLNGEVPKNYIYELAAKSPAPTEVLHYANRLIELEQWRERRVISYKLLEATKKRDFEEFSKAKTELDDDELHSNSIRTPAELGKEFEQYIESEELEAFPLPYKLFNDKMGGGLRRKQVTLIGGWSSHGKSVVIDQFLEHCSKQGYNCHLYINEMGMEDRTARSICRETSISYQQLIKHELNLTEKELVKQAIDNGNPYFSITECAGWSIHELVYDIRSRDFDIVGIDILHQFDYESEIELAKLSRFINRTSKQANCHIIATVHLNESRVNDVVRPRPSTRDIRGSGMLKNDADNVMFIYREQDSHTGDPLPPGWIYTSKVRNGALGVVPLMFHEGTFSFTEVN